MATTEFQLTRGARIALTIAGALCIVLIFALPIGVWIIYRARTAKLTLSDRSITARGLLTTHIDLSQIARIGICRVPVVAKGIGGALARQKVGGDTAINVCVITQAGKTQKFTVSMFENHEAITAQIHKQVGLPFEEITVGMLGLKWPEKLAAAS